MNPRCAAKAAAPVRAAKWWSTPPAWPAFPNPRALPNRRAVPCTTVRVPTVDPAARRAATAATGADAATVADTVTEADRAGRAVRKRWQPPVGQVGNLRADCSSARVTVDNRRTACQAAPQP